MISEEKVRVMTRLAMFSKKEQRDALAAIKYRKKDYVALGMIRVWAAVTAAYLLATALIVLYIVGMNESAALALKRLSWEAVFWAIAYLVITVIFQIMAYVLFGRHYSDAIRRLRPYVKDLKELRAICEDTEETKAKSGAEDAQQN